MMKKTISMVLAMILMLSLAACGPKGNVDAPDKGASEAPAAEKEQSMTLKLAHIRPQGSVADEDIRAFAADVEKRTNGTIKFEIYPASQLGDYTTVLERISIGDVDMQIAPIGTNLDKAFGISYCPYLVQNWEEAKKVYSSDGDLVSNMAAICEKNDIKLIGTYPLYFGGIALTKKPKDPANVDVREETKIRVPNMKAFDLTAQELGYISTPLPAADTFTSMQTGMVDGAIGYGAEGYYSNYRDLIKYYLPINDHFELWYACLSSATWEKMSASQREAITAAAKAMEEKRFGEAEKQEKEYEEKLTAAGIEVIQFTDEQLAQFAKIVREKVWPQTKADFNEEFFNSIVEKYNLVK
jgi:TRAP-type C4-dicarboxylate transport system substrate-binding protein